MVVLALWRQTGANRNKDIECTGIAAITCTPPASGTWNLNCADNCSWGAMQKIPGNVSITGTGKLNLSSIWNFTGTSQYIFISPRCELDIYPGGRFA